MLNRRHNFVDDESQKSNLGFLADDSKDAKMPKEWDNIIYYNHDGTKLLAYNKTSVVLWGCVQELMKEVEDLQKEVKKLKGKGEGHEKQTKLLYTMGSKSSKPTDTDYMRQIKDIDINEKLKRTFYCLTVLKNVLVVQKIRRNKSHKLVYKLPVIHLRSYSLI